MVKYLMTAIVTVVSTAVLFISIKDIIDLKAINEEAKFSNRLLLYGDIFSHLIVEKNFMRMKNRGSDLCEAGLSLEYVDYNMTDLFM